MADLDADLAERQRAYEESLAALAAASSDAREFRIPHRSAPLAYAKHQDASQREERLRKSFSHALRTHPANEYQDILQEASGVTAPEMSGFQWFAQNPSLLEATPKSDADRNSHARLEFVLRRVAEAAARNPAWKEYDGPRRQEYDTELGLSGNAKLRAALASPYNYEPYSLTDDEDNMLPLLGDMVHPQSESLTGSPLGDRMLELAQRPMSALYGGPQRWADNFAAGGAALAEGRLSDAGKDFAYAVPNLVSPAFHRGGPGMDNDWRGYVEPVEAAALDTASQLPLWMSRGVFPKRAGRGLSPLGVENRIRQHRDELLTPLYRQAARKHHPDMGGSAEAMQRINAAREAGDMETLLRYAQ